MGEYFSFSSHPLKPSGLSSEDRNQNTSYVINMSDIYVPLLGICRQNKAAKQLMPYALGAVGKFIDSRFLFVCVFLLVFNVLMS